MDEICTYLIGQAKISSGTDLKNGPTNQHKEPSPICKSKRLECACYSVTKAKQGLFQPNKIQQCGTYIEQEHSSSSIKGRSRSKTKKLTPMHDGTIPTQYHNKQTTPRATNKNQKCSFAINLVCCRKTKQWYMRYAGYRSSTAKHYHENHLPLDPTHATHSSSHLPPAVSTFINTCFDTHVSITQIVGLLLKNYNFIISPATLYQMRDKHLYPLVTACDSQPYGTNVTKLINI